MENIKVKPPQFNDEDFEGYLDEVEVWREVAGVPIAKQGLVLWYTLPSDHSGNIKKMIKNQVGIGELKNETGIDLFVKAMKEAFGKAEEIRDYEIYQEFFEDMKRRTDEKISDYIYRFNTAANLAGKHGMELPAKVKAMKISHNSERKKVGVVRNGFQ